MNKIKNYMQFGKLNVLNSFKSLYTYTAATFLDILTRLLFVFIQYFLWKAIYEHSTNIRGYNLNEMLLYLFIAAAISGLYPHNISMKFGRTVKKGDIIYALLKPKRIEAKFFFESLGMSLYTFLFSSLPILVVGIAIIHPQINLSLWNGLFFLLAFVLSYLFVFLLELNVGILSYYTNSLWGINNFKDSIISIFSGRLLPLGFYPMILQSGIKYSPFSAMYYLPINLLLGKSIDHMVVYFYSIVLSIGILAIIYRVVSRIMVKKLMINGG